MRSQHSTLPIILAASLLLISVHCSPNNTVDEDFEESMIFDQDDWNDGDVNDLDDHADDESDTADNAKSISQNIKNIYHLDLKSGRKAAKWNPSMKMNPEEFGSHMEGDIMESRLVKNGQKNQNSRWRGGVVPYVIDGHFNSHQRDIIKLSMADYHKKTCIRFVPRKNQRDYIRIKSNSRGCWSYIGRTGGEQIVNLETPGCVYFKGVVIHELMHAIGFWHEQSREDRDNYVAIQWGNIEKGQSHNFDKAQHGTTDGFGEPYDYRSVMHYSAYAFSRNNRPTIVPKSNIKGELGQRHGFSQTDVNKIRKMYKCKSTTI